MTHIQTDGLVLREIPYLETDKLLVVLTDTLGKVTVRARGARRRGHKLLAASQLLVFSRMSLFDYRGKYMLDEAELVETFFGLRQDIVKLALASYGAELTESLADEEVPAPELLRLLLNLSYALCKLGKPLALLKAAFELRALCLAGFQPTLSACADCGGQPAFWDLSGGQLYCKTCGAGLPSARALDSALLDALRHIVSAEQRKLYAFTVTDETLSQLGTLTEEYLLTQLEPRLPTLDFYKKL